MNTIASRDNNNKPGGTIDSWCGKCKLVLAHTIEAMVGNKPARVQCNTCKAQHAYKPNQPNGVTRQSREGTMKATATAPKTTKPRASKYQSLIKGKDIPSAKKYSSKDKYALGDVLDHPSFGFGVTTAVKDATKIEVLFEGGSKILIHGR